MTNDLTTDHLPKSLDPAWRLGKTVDDIYKQGLHDGYSGGALRAAADDGVPGAGECLAKVLKLVDWGRFREAHVERGRFLQAHPDYDPERHADERMARVVEGLCCPHCGGDLDLGRSQE